MRFIKPQKSGVELPRLTNPGAAADLVAGAELIDGEGNVITGTLPEKSLFYAGGCSPTQSGSLLSLDAQNPSDFMLPKDKWLTLASSLSNFGDAAAADVAAGKTMTSSAGVKVAGTLPVVASGEVVLKTVTKTIESGATIQQSAPLTADTLLKSGAIVRLSQTMASYGDATAADVKSGKTFTGADGYRKTGTYNPPTAAIPGKTLVGVITNNEAINAAWNETQRPTTSKFTGITLNHGDIVICENASMVGVVYNANIIFIGVNPSVTTMYTSASAAAGTNFYVFR